MKEIEIAQLILDMVGKMQGLGCSVVFRTLTFRDETVEFQCNFKIPAGKGTQ